MGVKRGKFIVVDGLDGIGKGEIERALRGYDEKQGKAVFDSIAWSKAYEKLPEVEDFYGIPTPHFNTVMTAEPTYVGIGKDIREELTRADGRRKYPQKIQVDSYSTDRLIQMQRVVVPALENGLNVLQSRCFSATLCYQQLTGDDEGKGVKDSRNYILKHPGNVYQIEHSPDLLMIPTIENSDSLIDRLGIRGRVSKADDSMFENAVFQGRLKPLYESRWLRDIFVGCGTQVAYINAGISKESTGNQAIEIYDSFLLNRQIPEQYRSVNSALEIK